MIQPIIVTFYKFTAQDICKLRKINKSPIHVMDMLPKYVINPDYGNIIESDYLFQFFNEDSVDNLDNPNEEFILFDIITSGILNEEISNIGLIDIFDDSKDFNKLVPYIQNFETFETFNRTIPWTTTILVNVKYTSQYDEYDFECTIFGIIDNNGNVINI